MHLVLNLVSGHSGQKDDWQCPAVFLDILQNVESIHIGHVKVEKHQVHFPVLQLEDGGIAVGGFIHLVAIASQVVGQGQSLDRGIVDQEDSRGRKWLVGGIHTGRLTLTRRMLAASAIVV